MSSTHSTFSLARRVCLGLVVATVLAGTMALVTPHNAQADGAVTITVTPNTGLVDGQLVNVSGSGFSTDVTSVGLAQCDGPTSTSCIGHTTVPAAGGSFSATFTVQLSVLGASCSVTPGRCVLGASNLNGDGGAFSQLDYETLTFATTPGMPTAVSAGAGNAQATVSWTAPASNGGAPITGYAVTPYIGYFPLNPTTFPSTPTVQTIVGLTPGTSYRFRVQAINGAGTGPFSRVSNVVTPTAPTVPGAPTAATNATASNAEASLSWTAPVSTGGAPITGYEVTSYVGFAPVASVTCASTVTSATVTGLTNGTTYRFKVAAINSVGTGPTSKVTNPVTPTSAATAAAGTVSVGPAARTAQLVAPGCVAGLSPLVILLHGRGSSAQVHDAYFDLTHQASSRSLYVLLPNGTVEQSSGLRFWDAMPTCCNFTSPPVDDAGYLRDLIAAAKATRPIDPARIYVLGHSNGGFMAYRLACDLSDQIAAIAVLAGSDYPNDGDCQPGPNPVSVLHLHGNADPTVSYAGGTVFGPPVNLPSVYPGAAATVARWAARAGCGPTSVLSPSRLDLDSSISGSETRIEWYPGCAAGVGVQLDTIEGGLHSPGLVKANVGFKIVDWLRRHRR